MNRRRFDVRSTAHIERVLDYERNPIDGLTYVGRILLLEKIVQSTLRTPQHGIICAPSEFQPSDY